jgi:TolA-binding protein
MRRWQEALEIWRRQRVFFASDVLGSEGFYPNLPLMKSAHFCLLILTIWLALQQSYSKARHYFSGIDQTRADLVRLGEEIHRQKLIAAAALYERDLIQQEAAVVVRKNPTSADDYPARRLASVLTAGAIDPILVDTAASLFKEGKASFVKGEYSTSARRLESLIKAYPLSPYSLESYFLVAESHFQAKDYEKCVIYVEDMVRLFPESELTGYSMLRAASIYRERERLDDAAEIYRTVIGGFTQPELRKQAATLLKEIEL